MADRTDGFAPTARWHMACSPPDRPSRAPSAWCPPRTGSPRSRRWPSWRTAATRSTRPWPRASSCTSSNPTSTGPPARCRSSSRPADGEVRVLCGQGVAPAGATVAHYRGLGLDLVPGTGPLAAAVPGAFDAWMLLLRDHGTKSLADVLQYAIGYAEDGHAPVENVGATVETVRELFETEWTSSARGVPAGRAGAPPRRAVPQPRPRRDLAAAASPRSSGGGRPGSPRSRRRARCGATGFIAEALVRQAGRPTLDTSGDRAHRHAHRRRPRRLVRDLRGPGDVRLERLDPVQGRPLEPGPGPPPATRAAAARAARVRVRRLRPPAHRGLQARHGRPGGLVRGRAPRCRSTSCCPTPYNAARRALVGDKASYELRPGSPGGRTPRLSAHARVVATDERAPASSHGRGGRGG